MTVYDILKYEERYEERDPAFFWCEILTIIWPAKLIQSKGGVWPVDKNIGRTQMRDDKREHVPANDAIMHAPALILSSNLNLGKYINS